MNTYTTTEVAKIIDIHPNTVRMYSIALTIIQTATTTIIQEKAENSMLGRVFGLMGAMYSGFLPVGMAIFGPLADILPLQWMMVGSGIGLVFVSVYLQVKFKLDM